MQSGSVLGRSLPRLRRAQLKWKVSGAGFCDPRATPCGFSPKVRDMQPPSSRSLAPSSLKLASQQEMGRLHIHNKERNFEWIPPLFYMTHQSALLHSAPRSGCRQTLPGLCRNMPKTPAGEWRKHLVKSGFNKSGYLVIFITVLMFAAACFLLMPLFDT